MHRVGGTMAAVIVAAGLMGASVAEAKDRAEAWATWSARAQSIDDALQSGSMEPVKTACNGVTGMLIGQGFQFPYWAQGLIPVCRVSKDLWLYSGSKRGVKRWCSDLKGAAAQIGKAEPVAEAPRASEIARDISLRMTASYDELCRK